MLFVCYPKCSTCAKAKAWLNDRSIAITERDIKKDHPNKDELMKWHKLSGLPLKRFFNTSGQLYREMELKDKLTGMSEEQQYELLAADGMLVKRPLLVDEAFVLVGFKEKEWAEKLNV